MKRKLSLLMVLMMVLTLIPAMPSFAASVSESDYTASDALSPRGFIPWSQITSEDAELLRPKATTVLKTLTASPGYTAPVTTGSVAKVEFTLSTDDKFVKGDLYAVIDGVAYKQDGKVIAGGIDETDDRIFYSGNYAYVNLNAGETLDEFRFKAELAEAATGNRVLTISYPNQTTEPKYLYAQVTGTAKGSVNRLSAIKEYAPNSAWKTVAGAKFEVLNPGYYDGEAYTRADESSAIEFRLSGDFNWVTYGNTTARTRVFIDGIEFDYTADTDYYDVNRNVLIIYPERALGAAYDGDEAKVVVEPVFSLTRDARTGQEVIVDVDSADAKGSVVIAKYNDFTAGIKVEDVREIMAGTARETKDYRVKITIEDNSNALATLRDIDMTFANGTAKLIRAEYVDGTKVDAFRQGSRVTTGKEITGYGMDDVIRDITQYADTFQFTTTTDAATEEYLSLEFYLRGDNNAGGKDMTVTVTGRGIDYKDVKVATVLAPVAMEVSEVKNIELGLQAQEAGTLVLTESKAGALERGREYEIVLNDTDSLNATGQIKVLDGYKLEVADGNGLNIRTSVVGGALRFTVLRESMTTPAKITISNMRVTTDRTVAYGDIKAELIPLRDKTFTAYNDGYRDTTQPIFDLTGRTEVQVDRAKTILASVKYMKLATEALTGVKKETVFTIGSTSFTVAGVANTLDAAPYISNNRTMLPIGTVAHLVGATVNYDTTTRTAVFTKDNLVVTMNLDTNMLLVNGSAVPMDAKPEIQNGRAFVSLVYVAQAFGIQNGTDIVYDAAAKTVTLFPNAK